MATVTVNIPNTTFVSSTYADNNFSFYPLMYTGMDSTFGNCVSYMQFTLPSLPVSMVDSAKLKFTVIVKNGGEPSPIVVNRVTSAFLTSSVTYNTQPASVATTSLINITTSDLYKTVEIDITALVNQWLTGIFPNNGIALQNLDGSTLVEFGTDNIVWEPYFPTMELTYSNTPATESSAVCFCYAQLAHLLEQLIVLYPGLTLYVFLPGISPWWISGIPYQVYKSAEGTDGGLFLLSGDEYVAFPLNAIAALQFETGTAVYNPAITYLSKPDFPPGCDTNIVTAIHEYVSTLSGEVLFNVGSNIRSTGPIYLNQYGLIVQADENGNDPAFIPVTHITGIAPQVTPSTDEKKEFSSSNKMESTPPTKIQAAIQL